MSDTFELPARVNDLLKSSTDLIAAIAQDADSGEVLMLAWMNKEALAATIATGRATYWSRSRNELWVKGATSGHTQSVISVDLDCDGDALLLKVQQVGGACHTGDRTCFHNHVEMFHS
ncbi:MAG TPA: phosphoribosyl-AMP cyclohydrolase [Candidatus Nanopelagicaceae bacterium]|jgi:phosphoribosyl-AMP cyclohydrolase